MYGYRVPEVQKFLGALPEAKNHEIKWHERTHIKRKPVMVSAGPIIPTIVQPHPDPSDPKSFYAGCLKRFLSKPPEPKKAKFLRFQRFVDEWLHENLKPLSPDTDVSTSEWLKETPYPAHRKEELWTKYCNITNRRDPRYVLAKTFQKDETYPSYKFARAINATSDEFKTMFGPYVKNIEKVLYSRPEFIKHVPVKDRADYIYKLLYRPGASYFGSDYTAFETHFVQRMMHACERKLFEYMYKNHPMLDDLKYFLDAKEGMRTCHNIDFTIRVEATRLSGEMDTSLSNGFTNLMLNLFVLKEKGCTNVRGVVEGDDGLFSFSGPCPTSQDYADVGFTIKLEPYQSLGEASFCGLVFDETDRIVVTDPTDVLATFGWLSAKYARARDSSRKALLRCKALSLAHQYPGCPILQTLAHKTLELTRNISIQRVLVRGGNMNMWEREQLLAAVKDEKNIKSKEVPMGTRLLVERLFNISVEAQLKIEEKISSMSELGILDIADYLNPPIDQVHYALNYMSTVYDEHYVT